MELGRLRDLTVPRARTAGFQPQVFARYQRRQPGVNALLRTAFISGVSTRQVGPLTALILDAAVSASTVSRVTQSLGAEVARFHARPLEDRACALLLDEVRLLVKGVAGRPETRGTVRLRPHHAGGAGRWRAQAPGAVACLAHDLETLLAFFTCPAPHWRKIRTTNAVERAFREVRRRTRPMSCFTNEASCDRIIYAVIHHLNTKWGRRALGQFTQKS